MRIFSTLSFIRPSPTSCLSYFWRETVQHSCVEEPERPLSGAQSAAPARQRPSIDISSVTCNLCISIFRSIIISGKPCAMCHCSLSLGLTPSKGTALNSGWVDPSWKRRTTHALLRGTFKTVLDEGVRCDRRELLLRPPWLMVLASLACGNAPEMASHPVRLGDVEAQRVVGSSLAASIHVRHMVSHLCLQSNTVRTRCTRARARCALSDTTAADQCLCDWSRFHRSGHDIHHKRALKDRRTCSTRASAETPPVENSYHCSALIV